VWREPPGRCPAARPDRHDERERTTELAASPEAATYEAAPVRLGMALLAGSLVFLGVCTVLIADGAVLAVEGMPRPRWEWVGLTVPLAAIALAVGGMARSRRVPLLAAGLIMVFTFLYGWETGFFESSMGPAMQTAAFLILSTVVGLTQRRGVPTMWALGTLVAFVAVTLPRGEGGVLVIGAVLGTPLVIAQGEVLAWSQERLRRARSRELRWAGDLHLLTSSIGRLRRGVPSDEAAATVAGVARSLLRADEAYVVLVDASGDPRPIGEPPFPFGPRLRGLVARANSTGEPVVSPDLDGDLLVLPMRSHDASVGAVLARRAARRRDAFGAVTLRLGDLLAAEAATVLQQIRTIEDLAAETQIDALTGAGNRRHAEHLLSVLDDGDALLVFDLDGFKPVNDTFGHAVGDQVLCELSAFLQRATRRTDAVARLGGDEFVVLLRAEDGEPASVAERLRQEWDHTEPLAAVSIGVAVHDPARTAGETLERADQALYRAKEQGGNRVQVHPGAKMEA
jgi:diguanylate cyclase (GGDEF)-like protein